MAKRKFHITEDGPKECSASVKACPVGGEHFTDVQLARKEYENQQRDKIFSTLKKNKKVADDDIFVSQFRKSRIEIPDDVNLRLAAFMRRRKNRSVAIAPIGSIMYNTQIPNRDVHDYDFVSFDAPDPDSKRMKTLQEMSGDLDITGVPVEHFLMNPSDNQVVMDAFYAIKANNHMFVDGPYGELVRSTHLPVHIYFGKIDSLQKGSMNQILTSDPDDDRQQADEQEMKDLLSGKYQVSGEKDLKRFKHVVRWELYKRRWGDVKDMDYIDPRLSSQEREKFLDSLSAGRILF